MIENQRYFEKGESKKPSIMTFTSPRYGLDVVMAVTARKSKEVIGKGEDKKEIEIPKGTVVGGIVFRQPETYSPPQTILSAVRGMNSFLAYVSTRGENSGKYLFPKYLGGKADSNMAYLASLVGFSIVGKDADGLCRLFGETATVKDEFKTFTQIDYPDLEERLLRRCNEINPEFWDGAPEVEGSVLIPQYGENIMKSGRTALVTGGISSLAALSVAGLEAKSRDYFGVASCLIWAGASFSIGLTGYKVAKKAHNSPMVPDWSFCSTNEPKELE